MPHTHACKDELAIATEVQAEIEEEEVKETEYRYLQFNRCSLPCNSLSNKRSRVARPPFAQRQLHYNSLSNKEIEATVTLSLSVPCNKQLVISDDAYNAEVLQEMHKRKPSNEAVDSGRRFHPEWHQFHRNRYHIGAKP